MLLKRYGVPLAVALVLYSLLYLLAGIGTSYISWALPLAVLFSYLIRLCDDIIDYEKDAAAGKAPLGQTLLAILACLTAVVISLIITVTHGYWMVLPMALIGLTLPFSQRLQSFAKPLFVPAILLTLATTFFSLTAGLYVLSVILLMGDGILVWIKEKRHDSDR